MGKFLFPRIAMSLLPIVICAQVVPTVSNILVDPKSVDQTTLRIFFDVSAKFTNYRVRVSTTGCVDGTSGYAIQNGTSPSTLVQYGMTASLSGLSAGTSYHLCPEVTADGTNWSRGIETVFAMPASKTGGEPAAPNDAALVSMSFPVQTGTTLTVAADCHDLQNAINTASYGDTILIPAGATCTTPLTLPDAPEMKSFQPVNVTTSTSTITLPNHGFADGQKVHLSAGAPNGGCLPGQDFYPYGLNCDKAGAIRKGKDYYVSLVDSDHFHISETPGGSPAPFGYITAVASNTTSTVTVTGSWHSTYGFVVPTYVPFQLTTTGTLPGGLSLDTDYYALTGCTNGASQVCTFQVSRTQGGSPIAFTSPGTGTMSIATHGSGPQYIMAWPPADKWIVMRTATPDSQFTPFGVRTSNLWQPKMATIKQLNAWPAQAMLNPGIMTHHWRFVGIEWTTATNSDYLTTTDPRPYGNLMATNIDNGFMIFDRNYVHGWGYPNRFGKVVGSIDGSNVGFIDSELSQMDYWHPWYSGFTPALVGTKRVAIAPGLAHMGTISPYIAGAITVDITGGTVSGPGAVYLDMQGVLNVVLPIGITANCSVAGTSCIVSNNLNPAVPKVSAGGAAGEPLVGLTLVNGALSAAYALDGFSSVYNTEGCQCFIMGNGPGPYLFDNNLISGSGIPLHFDDSGGPFEERGDYYIHRNTFVTPLDQMAGGAGSNGLRYGHRQPLEWKGGLRIKVDGNKFNSNFQEDTPTTPYIAFTPRAGGWMSDLQIINNTFQHGPLGLNMCGAIDSYVPVSRPCQRVLFRNNLFSDLNGFTHSSAGSPFGSGPGRLLAGGYAASDFVFDHNTIATDPRGTVPEFMHIQVGQVANTRVTSNIFWISNSASFFVGNENVFACPGGANKAFIDCVFPHNKFAGNVVVPSWLDTSVPTGALDPAGLCTAFGGQWKGSSCSGGVIPNLVNGPDVPSRIAAIRFQKDGSLRFDSPYASTGADGRDPGVSMETLSQAQGRIVVGDARAISRSSVTLSVQVPDQQAACMIGYGLSPDPTTWSRTTTDSPGQKTRTYVLQGLQSGKSYTGEAWCAGAPPRSLVFTTL